LIEEGLSKFDVFTTNVVHCHPSGNKPSLPGEIENCQDWLRKELAIVKPNIILTLGADARNSFRGMGMTMALKEGVRWFNTGFWVNPACSLHVGFYWLRHPASFLYSHADTTEWKNNFRRILDHVHTAKAERIK
jgi:uracil-DNA glycosylase family 4